MDDSLLLSACKFTLAPELQVVRLEPGLLVIKNIHLRTYLRVRSVQWSVLQLFAEAHTVPQALALAIEQRICPALSEFYELVLKAHARRVLVIEPLGVAPAAPVDWKLRLPPASLAGPLATSLVLALGAIVVGAIKSDPLPTLHGAGLGLLVWAGVLSLAQLLVASLIRGGGGDVYRPHLAWLPVPHLAFSTGDRQMLATRGRIATLLLPATLLAVATAALLWLAPGLALVPLAGVLLALHPFAGGALAEIMFLLGSPPPCDTDAGILFQPNRRLALRWKRARHELLSRTTWLRLLTALITSVAWAAVASWPSDGDLLKGLWDVELWPLHVAAFLAAPCVGLFIYGGREAALIIRKRHHADKRRWHRFRARWSKPAAPLTESERQAWLAQSPLFRNLSPIERGELSRHLKPRHYRSRQTIIDFGDQPTVVTLIVAGEVIVNRRLPTGVVQRLTRLDEGDLFGAHTLLDPARPEVQVRTRTPVQALQLDLALFQNAVIARLGQEAAHSLAIKLPILRRLPLCRLWHPQSLERFAQLSTSVDFPTDAVIIPENEEARYFFILIEGSARVTTRGRPVATLKAGQFFGEISLLQNSVTSGTVLAGPGARCLYISQRDFMRFLTHNFSAALELERVSSQRLGRPIFPLQR